MNIYKILSSNAKIKTGICVSLIAINFLVLAGMKSDDILVKIKEIENNQSVGFSSNAQDYIYSNPVNKPIQTAGCLADGVKSLKELKEKSYAIVKVKVIDQYRKSNLTTSSNLEIIKVYSGTIQNEIVLYQTGQKYRDKWVLTEGEYLLFLGKQDSTDEDNAYYIIGGTEGVFEIENDIFSFLGVMLRKEFYSHDFKNADEFIEWLFKQ